MYDVRIDKSGLRPTVLELIFTKTLHFSLKFGRCPLFGIGFFRIFEPICSRAGSGLRIPVKGFWLLETSTGTAQA